MRSEARVHWGGACALVVLSLMASARLAVAAGAATPASAPIQPHPAFPAPLAARSLLLDVVRAGNRLIAVGAHGDIVRSDDGDHWTQSPSPVRGLLTALQFVGTDRGWAVGQDAVILHTRDGGERWTVQNFQPALQAPILNLLMLDARHGFVVGAFGLLKKTDDGGATWTDVKSDPIAKDQLHLYRMIRLGDGELLIAAEQGTLYASADAGSTWNRVKSPYSGSFFGALPVGGNGALIFGLRGHAYLSDDVSANVVSPKPSQGVPVDRKVKDSGAGTQGDDAAKPRGGNWKTIDTSTVASFFGGARLADGRFVLVGSSGTIALVAADGSTVRLLKSPTDQDLDAVLPFGHGLLVVGSRGVFRVRSLDPGR